MKAILTIISVFFLSNFASGQSGWFQQQTGTDITLRSVFMTDNNTGYAVGGDILIDDNRAVDRGIILKTTNSGVNWFSQVPANFDKILFAVTFPNNQTGYAVGRDASAYAVFKTTNEGINWVLQELPSTINSPPLYSVYFFNAETGFTTGGGGRIFKTTNGGTNWIVNNFSNVSSLYSITFTGSTGYIASDNIIYRTTNTGASWDTSLVSIGTTFQFIQFTGQNTGYAAGGDRIFKTTNAGDNWNSVQLSGSNLSSIYFPSPNTGYCTGLNTSIYRTTNAGTSWTLQTMPGGTPLYSTYFSNDTMGFAVGNVGFMLRTTTGGTVGISIISTQIPDRHTLKQNYPNPFNPRTIINYEIAGREFVNLSIYDISGKLILQAVNGLQNAGSYRYAFDGENLPGGVYFYKLRAGEYAEVRKMILLK